MANVKECECNNCGTRLLTVPGTPCGCGGKLIAQGEAGMLRKALGKEDTDLRKA